MKLQVLYEDNHLIAVFKPAGVPSQPDETGDSSMLDAVRKHLKDKYHKPGNAFVGLVHRLDRPAQGVMLFAKTGKGASRLSLQFRDGQVSKTYYALVRGKPERQGTLMHRLEKSGRRARAGERGTRATLRYRVAASGGGRSLLEISIAGGKFHQIRAQLAAAGFPIIGDLKYRGEAWDDKRSIALCATRLSFTPATGGDTVSVWVPWPAAWRKYLKM